MKLKKFIDILNKEPANMQSLNAVGAFFKQHGKDIFKSDKLLLTLLEQKWHKKKITQLYRLEWIIRFRNEIYGNDIDMLPLYRYFAEYMSFGCSFFGNLRVPFEEWEDLAKEQVDILKILVKKNQLKSWKRIKLVHQLGDKGDKRADLLIEKGSIDPAYINDPMGL